MKRELLLRMESLLAEPGTNPSIKIAWTEWSDLPHRSGWGPREIRARGRCAGAGCAVGAPAQVVSNMGKEGPHADSACGRHGAIHEVPFD
jgi:hypothetical protein